MCKPYEIVIQVVPGTGCKGILKIPNKSGVLQEEYSMDDYRDSPRAHWIR